MSFNKKIVIKNKKHKLLVNEPKLYLSSINPKMKIKVEHIMIVIICLL